jgi:hypothetical protein
MNEEIGKYVRWSDFLAPASSFAFEEQDSLQPKLPNLTDSLEAISKKDQHIISRVWPLDEFNTQLLDNVHPPSWQDPKAHNGDGTYSYDMVVIGGGTGGLITAAGSAGVGAKVAMIEEHMLGGDW